MINKSEKEFLVMDSDSFEEMRSAGIYPHTTTSEDRYTDPRSVDYRVFKELKQVLEKEEYRMLDVGSSSGDASESLVKKLEDKTDALIEADALDPNQEMLQECMETELSPVKGAGQKLPFKENTYDIVVSSQIFLPTEDMYEIIEEIERVVKPEGYTVLSSGYVLNDSKDYRGLHTEELQPEIFQE